jgi:nicotinamidase-related amidase
VIDAWQVMNPLPLPPHYHPASVGQVWRVPYQERAAQAVQWAEKYAIAPAASDRLRLLLIAVDVQNTFCIPEFELFVGGRSGKGAVEDNQRLCEFIYRNLGALTEITLTLDTHRAMQIFHPIFLVDAAGNHPSPMTLVSHEDVRSGRWMFNPQVASSLGITPEYGQEHLLHYTKELKERHKYDLTIWPYHAMFGGIGHAVVSAVEEAIFFHTIARNSQVDLIIKGQMVLTESYSAMGPEVLDDAQGKQIAQKNQKFLQKLIEFDAVVVAGQAKSHCVAWTLEDLLGALQAHDERLAQRIYLLEDCTSPVVVPGVVDYTDEAEAAYQRFAQAGMHLVRSDQPLEEWPGLSGI